jgi:hypothetical protein
MHHIAFDSSDSRRPSARSLVAAPIVVSMEEEEDGRAAARRVAVGDGAAASPC